MLRFLADHNFNFDFPTSDDAQPDTLAGKLRKREIKSNQKIAAAIEQMKRSYR